MTELSQPSFTRAAKPYPLPLFLRGHGEPWGHQQPRGFPGLQSSPEPKNRGTEISRPSLFSPHSPQSVSLPREKNTTTGSGSTPFLPQFQAHLESGHRWNHRCWTHGGVPRVSWTITNSENSGNRVSHFSLDQSDALGMVRACSVAISITAKMDFTPASRSRTQVAQESQHPDDP